MKRVLFVMAFAITSFSAFAQEAVEGVKFNGDYFEGGSPDKPGIIILGGSDGGKYSDRAMKIADMGYNVLALEYFNRSGADNVPETLELIPLEYFEEPKRWLALRNNGVILYGLSKGAELALVLASYDNEYKAVVALAPSKVVWQGNPKDFSKIMESPSSWSKDGEGLPFVPYISREEQQRLGFDNRHAASLTNVRAVEQARIDVQNIHMPVLLLSGGKDKSWPATEMAEEICSNIGGNCTHINYPDGDHLLTNYEVTVLAEIRKFLRGL